MKNRIKSLVFRAVGKEPEAIVVSFLAGDPALGKAMLAEIRKLIPDRRHLAVTLSDMPGLDCEIVAMDPGSVSTLYVQLRRRFRRYRIALAPVLFTKDGSFSSLRKAAILLAPTKILAYNARLERHHLKLRNGVASALFLRGVPLDRIFLRPKWLVPWKRDRSVYPDRWKVLDGRPLSNVRPRVAVLSPYFPYPLAHGGAVRIYHLLREAARQFDIFLFAFVEDGDPGEFGPVLEFCSKVILVPQPRYREPRWSTLNPPEVCEYSSPVMHRLLRGITREYGIRLVQTEYTGMAAYGGDVLVEHDLTFDLYNQIHQRERTVAAWWDWTRWRRFETARIRAFKRVVVMSEKDASMLGAESARVIANGVDIGRFRPEPEQPGKKLLFIGSFRHFPNVVAFRFFTEQVWPTLREKDPEITLTVVAGNDPVSYWRAYTDSLEPPSDPRIRLLEFVRDVRPLYVDCNLVIVPTLVSAGTNVKVLEAMAMHRAVVTTSSGCAGLGLEHKVSSWIDDSPAGFAAGIETLLGDVELRTRMSGAARLHAEQHFDWCKLGERQIALWRELLNSGEGTNDGDA